MYSTASLRDSDNSFLTLSANIPTASPLSSANLIIASSRLVTLPFKSVNKPVLNASFIASAILLSVHASSRALICSSACDLRLSVDLSVSSSILSISSSNI